MEDKDEKITQDALQSRIPGTIGASQRINKLGNLNEIREKRMAGDMIGIDDEQSTTDEDTSIGKAT